MICDLTLRILQNLPNELEPPSVCKVIDVRLVLVRPAEHEVKLELNFNLTGSLATRVETGS